MSGGMEIIANTQFPCPVCKADNEQAEEFDSEEDLDTHVRGVHLKWTPYQCLYCDKTAAGPLSLKKHAAIQHHGQTFRVSFLPDETKIAQLESIRDQSPQIRPNSFPCTKCEDEGMATNYELRSQLLAHVRENHLRVRPFACHYCARVSSCWLNVRNHIRIRHEGADIKIVITPDEALDLEVERIAQGFGSRDIENQRFAAQQSFPVLPTDTMFASQCSQQRVKTEPNSYANNVPSCPQFPSYGPMYQHPFTGASYGAVSSRKRPSGSMGMTDTRRRNTSTPEVPRTPAHANNTPELPGSEARIACRLCNVSKELFRHKSRRLLHVYRSHLPRKDFVRCPCCAFSCPESRGKVVAHMKEKHPDVSDEPIDERSAYREQAHKIAVDCFGNVEDEEEQAGEEENSNLGGTPVQCRLCKANVLNKEQHVLREHFRRNLLLCSVPGCDFGSLDQLGTLKQHFTTTHPDKTEFHFIDKREKYKAAIEELERKCFPSAETEEDTAAEEEEEEEEEEGSSPHKKTNWNKFCKLCRRIIKSGSRAHCFTHLGFQSVKCPVDGCGYGSNFHPADVRKHMQKKHPDSTLEPIDSRADHEERVRLLSEEILTTQSPEAEPPVPPKTPRRKPPAAQKTPIPAEEVNGGTQCKLCEKTLRKSTCAMHIWRTHMDLPVLRCPDCDFFITHNDKHRFIRHYPRSHPKRKPAPINETNSAKVRDRYAELYKDAFGHEPSTAKRGSKESEPETPKVQGDV